MIDSDVSNSAFDTDKLMRMANEAHSIADHGKDQATLLRNFQKKVEELLFYRQESIDLKAQLQIANETCKIMEAEFAFQKSELESELERKNQTEKELREALFKKESEYLGQTKYYDVNALVNQKEFDKYKQLAEELQNKLNQVQEDNERLKQQNETIQKDNKILKEKNEKIEQEKEEIKKEVDTRPNPAQIEELQKKIQRLQKRIEKRNQAISELQTQNETLKQSLSNSGENDANSQLSYSGNEQERIRMKLERALTKLEKLKQVEQNNKLLQQQLEHYEAERQILNDIMQLEETDPKEEWIEMREKVKEGMNAITKLKETSSLLESAEKKISEFDNAEEEIKSLRKKIFENEEKMAGVTSITQKLVKTESEFEAYKKEMLRIENYAQQQKLRCDYAKIIAENQHQLISSITDLHYTLTGNKEQLLRPIALSIIFLTRWSKLVKESGPLKLFDQSSLVAFTSIPSHSVQKKLDTIKDIFVSLSNKLLTTKTAVDKYHQKVIKYRQSIRELGGDFEANTAEIQNAQRKCQVYKDMIHQLNEKLVELVSVKKFEKALSHSTSLELEIEKLNKQISSLKEEIGNKDGIIKDFNNELHKADLKHQSDTDEKNSVEKELDTLKTKYAILNAKFKERTKELLSLERIVHMKCPDILPISTIQNIENYENEDNIYQPQINPLFLGDFVPSES